MRHTINMGYFNWVQGEKFGRVGSRVPAHSCWSVYEYCEETGGGRWLGSFLRENDAVTYARMVAAEMNLTVVVDTD